MIVASLAAALLGLVFCLLLGMAFSALETTTLSLNRRRLLALFGDSTARHVDEQEILAETKEIYFVSRLGQCASLLVAGALCFHGIRILLTWLPPQWPDDLTRRLAALVLTLVLLTPLYLMLVYAAPRFFSRAGASNGERQESPRWMRRFLRLIAPLLWLPRLAQLLPLGKFLPRHELTKSDLVALVTELDFEDEEPAPVAQQHATDEEEFDEEEMIFNILDLEESWVREVMRPINEVVAVRLGTGFGAEALRDLARATGYSRFPVYRERIVNLVGYLSIYDVLFDEAESSLEAFVREPLYVPEFMRVSELLDEFRERGEQVAVVVDEYGGSSGWITREDVLEEIVGDIEDEFDLRRRLIHPLGSDVYEVDGKIDVDDLAEEIPLAFDDPPYDTLAGFLLHELGRIPEEGAVFETEEAQFRVLRMEGRRIAQVRIEVKAPRREA